MPLTGGHQLRLTVFNRLDDPANPKQYQLVDVTSQCTFELLAPFNAVGHRFDDLPVVDPATGVVNATKPGVFLMQVRRPTGHYQVARLQVHTQILDWWFGNDSITTAVDTVAHAQPSIYARFSEDPVSPGAAVGCDVIGDITGHGYVTLTPSDATKFTVSPTGRLRGLAETAEPPPTVSGTLAGHALPAQTLPVRVVDYAKARNDLQPVRAPTAATAADKHNIVFLAEGFRDTPADRALFDRIVTTTAAELFEKPRHEPYGLLKGSINVFKAFLPSREHTLTTGFRVTDRDGQVVKGTPIPAGDAVSADTAIYTPEILIRLVGLPPRNETRGRDALVALWSSQGLPDFAAAKVDGNLAEAWKQQRSEGILHARDTAFGIHLGQRLADHGSGVERDPAHPVSRPATDTAGAAMTAYLGRLYEIFTVLVTRLATMDPRRHAPERVAGQADPGGLVMSYLGGLRFGPNPALQIGTVWLPDPAKFVPSRGLVGVVCNDGVAGGANINDSTMTTSTLNQALTLSAAYANPALPREMRRTPPNAIEPNLPPVIDTVAHEFGHSFNLGDEYEEFNDDDPDAAVADGFDNLAHLETVRLGAAPSRDIDVTKIKWFALPRMRVADRLLADATGTAAAIQVSIDPTRVAAWVQAQKDGRKADLLQVAPSPRGKQLPVTVLVENLTIGQVNERAGTIPLTGALPGPPFPTFPKGSVVFVPLADAQGKLVTAVEAKVRAFLADVANHHDAPLNSDTDHVNRRVGKDTPVSISGFKAPCKSERLVGIFEGAHRRAGAAYRPTGACKMRSFGDGDEGEFCFVCKWLIVNRVDPGFHAILSEKFYPEAKKNG